MAIAIIVHGGAKTVPDEKVDANQAGCRAAVEAGWTVLKSGGSAKEAVEVAIRVLESDPTFNAGFGATLNTEGQVCLDAAMMEGHNLRWGAVAAIQGVPHPISVARLILDEKPQLLVADGAEKFARDHQCEQCNPEALISDEQYQQWQTEKMPEDRPATVGCVALDSQGLIVAGASTGGLALQPPGRVGDTAIIGAGVYADGLGGCASTGDGECIIPVTLAKAAIDFLHQTQNPSEAVEQAIAIIKQGEGEAGCIMLNANGECGWAFNSDDMPVAYMSDRLTEPVISIDQPVASTVLATLQR